MRCNLAERRTDERAKIDLDKRAAFVMWSMVLDQPRAKGGKPMTRREINDELQATPAELYEYHLSRLVHWREYYEQQLNLNA